MWLALLFSLLFSGSSLVGQFMASPQSVDVVSTNACYSLESGTRKTIMPGEVATGCEAQLAGKTFIRIRQQVKIVNSKIQEGMGYLGTCDGTALRRVNPLVAGVIEASPGDIFWEGSNYLGDDLSDFIFIFTAKDDRSYIFDVYINETKKDDLPDFIKNCKEVGGLIPVSEGAQTAVFPPQALSLTDNDFNTEGNQNFDKSCCETDFNNNLSFFDGKYFMKLVEMNKPDEAMQVGTITKTIGTEIRTYDVFFHADTVYLVGQTGQPDAGVSWMYNPAETKPPTSAKERNPSLQLTAMKFITVSQWTWATPECKPALYLYPEKPMEIAVKIKPKGRITVSDPEHGENGWQVFAYPNGTLRVPSKSYPYLYYETELEKVKVPEEGWLVEKEDLQDFFTKILPRLGLNEKEEKDFLDYWPAKLAYGKRWFIGLIDRGELDRVEQVEFSTAPENFIRLRFYFEELSAARGMQDWAGKGIYPFKSLSGKLKINLLPPILPRREENFTAVDWGGIIENGSCGEVEKSQ